MSFNQDAFRTLVERLGFDHSELHDAITKETDHFIGVHTLEAWYLGERLNSATVLQLDALYKYAAATGNRDLEFYIPSRT